mmetsp:Transcript_29028/g.88706  ORF Transcript_29028/g.88706 Transcript_29028/m.88706 type:complete len:135 (-) Transcript_29028:83-487(-)
MTDTAIALAVDKVKEQCLEFDDTGAAAMPHTQKRLRVHVSALEVVANDVVAKVKSFGAFVGPRRLPRAPGPPTRPRARHQGHALRRRDRRCRPDRPPRKVESRAVTDDSPETASHSLRRAVLAERTRVVCARRL